MSKTARRATKDSDPLRVGLRRSRRVGGWVPIANGAGDRWFGRRIDRCRPSVAVDTPGLVPHDFQRRVEYLLE